MASLRLNDDKVIQKEPCHVDDPSKGQVTIPEQNFGIDQ